MLGDVCGRLLQTKTSLGMSLVPEMSPKGSETRLLVIMVITQSSSLRFWKSYMLLQKVGTQDSWRIIIESSFVLEWVQGACPNICSGMHGVPTKYNETIKTPSLLQPLSIPSQSEKMYAWILSQVYLGLKEKLLSWLWINSPNIHIFVLRHTHL